MMTGSSLSACVVSMSLAAASARASANYTYSNDKITDCAAASIAANTALTVRSRCHCVKLLSLCGPLNHFPGLSQTISTADSTDRIPLSTHAATPHTYTRSSLRSWNRRPTRRISVPRTNGTSTTTPQPLPSECFLCRERHHSSVRFRITVPAYSDNVLT